MNRSPSHVVAGFALITMIAMLAVPLSAHDLFAPDSYSNKISGFRKTPTSVAFGDYQNLNSRVHYQDENAPQNGGAIIRGRSTGGANTAIGYAVMTRLTSGPHNTGVGYAALRQNTRGNGNVAVGSKSLEKNTTGDWNTAVGYKSLARNTQGKENTALGMVALSSNTTGNFNTATGRAALKSSKTGSDNTANGAFALERNTTGRGNSAFGAYALQYTSTNEYDSAFGYHTLWKSKGGIGHNAAFGAAALRDTELGTRNTAIGFRAGGKNINGNNNVFIGYEAGYRNYYRYQIDKLVIANGKDSRNELITGDFRAHTVNINGDLHASGNLTENSDARLKKDIKPLTHALDAVLQLQAKTYRWKEDTAFADQADIGLVAQDVEKVFPELVAENEQGFKGIAYSKLTAVLIEAVKEQQGQLTAQQDQIASLETENTQLKTIMAEQMDALLARVAMLEGESLAAN